MEISHIFRGYFHLSSGVISAHRMSCCNFFYFWWRLMHETRNHQNVHVDDQTRSQWPKPNFWEPEAGPGPGPGYLYFPINQIYSGADAGPGLTGGWGDMRVLQVMDCWPRDHLPSPLSQQLLQISQRNFKRLTATCGWWEVFPDNGWYLESCVH